MFQYLMGLAGCYVLYRINNKEWIDQRRIKRNIKNVWNELRQNIKLEGYCIDKIALNSVGATVLIRLPLGGTFSDIEANKEQIDKAYECKSVLSNVINSNKIQIDLIFNDITELEYKVVELPGHKLLIGYDFRASPIIADMLLTPHLLVTGLSGNGKTGCIRIMIKNLLLNNNADIMLLNAFMDDYEGFNIESINNHNDIKDYIKELLEGIEEGIKRDKPLYVIFEELGKVKDKELIDLATKLLQYGRHNKIYLIGIIQTATKEELKFKSLFNSRLTFKQLEESSYRVVLGCSIDEKLKKREFYLFTDDLYKGKTYRLDF